MTSSVTLLSAGSGTATKTGPGVLSTVTVVDAASSTAASIVLTRTTNIADGRGPFDGYISAQDGDGFTVTVDKRQLTASLTFDYMIVAPAVA